MKNRFSKILLGHVSLFWIIVGCSAQPEMNILLITADTLRADHLGCYGYERNTSPNIDNLASKSIRFTNASSVINNTNPSHISIFTSTYPRNHEVYTNWTPLNQGSVTMSEILRNNGYRNAAFVSANHLNAEITGLGKGFDIYRDVQSAKVHADETIDSALQWIQANSREKFFVWIHLFDPHMPYSPPAPYDREFDPYYDGWGKIFFDVFNRKVSANKFITNPRLSESEVNTLIQVAQGKFALHELTYNKIGLSERDVDYIKSLYDGEIKFMDAQVGRLVSELENLKLNENTVVIFTADHGESFGEHGIYCEHKGIYEPSLAIPLTLYLPNVPARKVDTPVSNMDILPTVLDFLGITLEPEIVLAFDGKSLMPLAGGGSDNLRGELYVEHANNLAKGVKKNNYKYIIPVPENFGHFPNGYRHEEELYDLIKDRAEEKNLITDIDLDATPYKSLRANMSLWAGQPKSTKSESEEFHKLEQEQREKLKALGYIN